MGETQFLGMLVIGLTTIIGLFSVIIKPITSNTKAMTELVMRIDTLTEKMEERDKELKEHIEEFESYKNKVRESQKKQWDKIDELSDDMIRVKQNINAKGGNKHV